jgi:UDP-N-acetylglucosamine--N-acetylmuramyl-(pentapeptide) pyrophosphoryl-undecaprenol N-acetylglucosamine transferase
LFSVFHLKILFVGGGSIGHIAPALAVWEACKQFIPDVSAHFVCSPRPDDAHFLRDNNLPYSILNAPRLSPFFPFAFFTATGHAKKILEEQQPDIIFSKGSYVSLPLCFAAKKKKIPIVLHESDSVSGNANRIVARWADQICTGFPSNFNYTGNPLRDGVVGGSKEEALRITGFDGSKPILLVMGGSQGALAINEVIFDQLDDLLLRCDVMHITGRGKYNPQLPNTNHYYQTEFVNEELPHMYAAADLVLSRAGAGSIAELAANGIPSIFVPLRGVGHDHQYKNAKVVAKHGSVHLEQSDLSKKLLPTVHDLIADTQKRESMSAAMIKFCKPDAALQITKIIAQTLDS